MKSQSKSKSACRKAACPTMDCMSEFRTFKSPTASEIKAESVMDSTYYTEVESSIVGNRGEDAGQSTEETVCVVNKKEEDDILINMKQEDEDGGERQSVKIEMEHGATDGVRLWVKKEIKREEQEEEILTQQGTQTWEIDVKSEGNLREVTLHHDPEKVHPEEHSRPLNSRGNGAEKPLPPSSTHQHPKPPKTPPTPTKSHTGTQGIYVCSQCGKGFTAPSRLARHERTHTGERPYCCSQCGKSYTQSDALKIHQRTHTGECLYVCSQCGKSFTRPSSLIRHKQIHTGERPYHCSQCGKSFTQFGNLKIHQYTHTGESPYKCSQCEKSFKQSCTLKKHERTHTGERPYQCAQCGKRFSRLSTLRVHLWTHTGQHPYQCSQCGKHFADSGNLKKHQITHAGNLREVTLHQHPEKVHPEEHSRPLNSGGNGAEKPLPPSSTHQHPKPPKTSPTPTTSHTGTPGDHVCSLCGKGFTTPSLLTKHMQTHTGERPFHCSQCGKRFGRLDCLKKHQRTHTGERPYNCSQCEKSFCQLSQLKIHQRTHTEECPYLFSQGGKSFNQLGHLKIHQRTYQVERPYKCPCGKRFSTLSALKVHHRTHTGEPRLSKYPGGTDSSNQGDGNHLENNPRIQCQQRFGCNYRPQERGPLHTIKQE